MEGAPALARGPPSPRASSSPKTLQRAIGHASAHEGDEVELGLRDGSSERSPAAENGHHPLGPVEVPGTGLLAIGACRGPQRLQRTPHLVADAPAERGIELVDARVGRSTLALVLRDAAYSFPLLPGVLSKLARILGAGARILGTGPP